MNSFRLPAWFRITRTGRAISGLFVDYLGSTTNAALSFFITPVLVAILGGPMYGFWITASQILVWLSLLDGGIGANLIKIIGAHKDSDPDRVGRAIASTFWCYATLGGVTLLAGGAMAPFVAGWTHLGGAAAREGTITFVIGIVTSALALVAVPTFYVILQGYQKLALVNTLVNGVNIAGALAGLILVWMHFGIVGLAVGQLGGTVVGAALAWIFARRFCVFSLLPRFVNRAELLEMGRFAAYFTMSKLAFLGSKYSDTILIALFYGTAPVAVFSLTQKLASIAFMFGGKVGPVVVPGLAEIMGGKDHDTLSSVMLRMISMLTRLALLAATMIVALNHRFVSLWVGQAMFGGAMLTVLFAWGVFRDILIRNVSSLLFASGDLEGWGILSLVEAGAKIGLSIALLPSLGIIAPILGTAIAELITGIYIPVKLRQMLGLQIRTMMAHAAAPAFLRSLPTIAVAAVLAWLVPMEWRWFGIALIGISGVAANVIVFDAGRIGGFLQSALHPAISSREGL
ncbi:MAG TPA: oligosaccharide flippase family protein [Thermoanaerobaculia bacterium]|jgi:O-antigen/teichoic acid export membrane protein